MRSLRAALLLGLSLAACRDKPAPSEAGKAYYDALNCKACHRIGAEGSDSGPDLTMVGFRRKREWLETWLASPRAWKPDAQMPDPNLSPKARAAVAEYLSGLKGQAFSGAAPWDAPEVRSDPVARGRAVYSKAGCIACHGKGGAGGSPNNNVAGGKIPALDNAAATFTKEELVKKIRAGVKPQKADPAGPEPLVLMPAWGEALKDDAIGAVADYLLSLKPARPSDGGW